MTSCFVSNINIINMNLMNYHSKKSDSFLNKNSLISVKFGIYMSNIENVIHFRENTIYPAHNQISDEKIQILFLY